MTLTTQPYKGARDFYPEDKRLQDYIFGVMRDVVKSYGYEEYDAPILEPLDLYRAKTGDEIVNEQVYSFMDRGGREVAVRPEMTPTISRMVAAKRQELAYPARLFSIPNLWRYERPQRGRLREHWQLNVDIFGEEGLPGDHEVIMVADSILKAFGAKPSMYEIQVNSRKLINAMLENLDMDEADKKLFLKVSDKWQKFSSPEDRRAYIEDCLEKSGYGDDKKQAFMDKISKRDEAFDTAFDSPPAKSLRDLVVLLKDNGVNVQYNPYLARGFDYYDDVIFEVFDTNPENNRSMFGGGRYDGLVGLFGVEPVPTVGFGVGDVTIANFLETHDLLPELKSEVDAVLIVIGDVYVQSQKLINDLREMGLNIAVDATDRKLATRLKHADKHGASHVIFVGADELADEQYGLKNLKTGEEHKLSSQRLVTTIKDYRK